MKSDAAQVDIRAHGYDRDGEPSLQKPLPRGQSAAERDADRRASDAAPYYNPYKQPGGLSIAMEA